MIKKRKVIIDIFNSELVLHSKKKKLLIYSMKYAASDNK